MRAKRNRDYGTDRASKKEAGTLAADNACGSTKNCYRNRAHAQSAAANIAANHRKPMWVYKCKTCRYWHMTKRGDLPDSVRAGG